MAQRHDNVTFNPQLSRGYPSCTLYGLVADCGFKEHSWVPVLPRNITQLFLNNNRIGEINRTSLRAYEELERLDLGQQQVVLLLRDDAFLGQRKLRQLELGYNRGLRLEPLAFAGLLGLRQLHLYYCDLTESVLAGSFLEPLLSLQHLDLSWNQIASVRPGRFFSKLTYFSELDLRLNPIRSLCEGDLAGFRGKHFRHLNLHSVYFPQMKEAAFDWEKCGNPFRQMAFGKLDLSSNGFTLNTLRRFLKAIEGTSIDHLVLSGHIGKGFSHQNLPDLLQDTFEGLVSSGVQIMDLSRNRISTLMMAVFRPLRDVMILDMSRNEVNQIYPGAFHGLQGHLRLLNLSSNLLGEVYENTFEFLTELRVLDLSHNHIGALGKEAFRDLPRLRGLYLTGNSLRNLGFPSSLPNLEVLMLGDNRLNNLHSIITLGANSTHVDIQDNRLTNMEDVYMVLSQFPRLENFMFGGNFIKWCVLNQDWPFPRNSSVKVLDLHDSSLQVLWERGSCLNLFDHLNSLRGLNLSFNFLESLPPGIFAGLSSVQEVDLSFNALTFLHPDVFPSGLAILHIAGNFLASPDPGLFQTLAFLDLEGNRFHCDCHLEAFLAWLNVTNVTHLSPVAEYRCAFPAALQDQSLLGYSRSVQPCEVDDEESTRGLRVALFVFTAGLVITAILCGTAYARLRGHIFILYKKMARRVLDNPGPTAVADERRYDVFLCFSGSDYRWVEAAVLKKLDSQLSESSLRCCFEARDFLPGEDHLSNIRDAIWGSRKTLCIVSKEFLKGRAIRDATALSVSTSFYERLSFDLNK